MRPWARLAAMAALLTMLAPGHVPAAALTVHVLGADGHPVAGAVVMAQSLEANARHPAPQRAIMDQVNRAFEPDLLVIPVGSTIEFPNSDSVSHQIYSFSPAKRFQLPLYRGKPYPPVPFETPGIVVLGCNIHDRMLAYVVVTDAAYFGRTDAAGAWSGELAPGHYRISAWHPRMREESSEIGQPLTATEASSELTLRLTRPLEPAPLVDRHSWDY